ncbi:unnamed protein product [Paramecium primaurelia]|uniref:Uncharacterized protein n=1 Tax=Paramecium primaurelia TaxID=5886 RepID=A0A8S1N7U8_PARPR|nr:unnamed protein product [Paramecium primaurelia]
MLKLIEKLCNTLRQQLEQYSQINDMLETNIVRFVKDCMLYIFHIPLEYDIEQYFTIAEIDKTMFNIQQFLNSIQNKNHFKCIFMNEGFQSGEQSSSDEFDSIIKPKPKIHKTHSLEHKPTDIPITENDLTQLNNLQQLLYETNLKVTKRDEQILQMTTNYLKDIQHLKLMFLKQLENPETEFYEVNYFDIKQALEPELQNYIQDKFNQLQKQCQQTVQRYKIELTALSTECESHKRTISVLLQNNTLQSIIKMLFLIEKDPYKIWKQIQDQVGNKIIFQVFENQIGGYGINYREIDELISKNSAGGRMFCRQKQQYEEQLKIMIDDNIQIISNLKQDIQNKEQIIEELQISYEENTIRIQDQFNEDLEQKLKEQQINLSQEFDRKLKIQQKDLTDPQLIRKLTMKCAFARWMNFSKFYRIFEQEQDEDTLYELKLRINQCLKQVNDEFTIRDYEKLIQNYQQAQYNIIKFEQEKNIIEQKCKQQQLEIQKHKNTIQMQTQTIQALKQEVQNHETTIKLISKPFSSILQRLGYPSKINLLSILKSGINLEFLQNEDPEIQSSLITFFQLAISQQIIHQSKLKRDAETITEFFDIRYAMSQELNEDSNYQQHRLQSPEVPLIQFQITDQAISPKDQLTNSYIENKFQIKGTQKTSNHTNQSPKSIRVQNQYQQINTPKISNQKRDNKNENIAVKREKKSQQQLLDTTSSGFQKQVEKVRRKDHLMIQEINYVDKGTQVDTDYLSYQNKNSPSVQFRDNEQNSIQQDVLVILRDEGDSRATSVTKRRSLSQNNKKQQFNIPNQFINNQNLTLYQASKLKSQNKTIYSEQQQIQQNISLGFGFLPTSPFQFYQELFREKQKLQLKNYTIIKDQGVPIQNIQKRKIEPSIEGKHLQIPSYLK